ncbi:MAG: glycerate kinase [Erysipelotrichaceae bacterium]|nr:glycerate kinase [Erysipelotrichaceae bacterium]
MKILAAFDSFKESISAQEAGYAVMRAVPDAKVIIKPMADGGEGTMEAINASLGGEVHTIEVTGPLFNKVEAKIAICDDLAVIECAQACGLELLKQEEKDGIHTTTYGVGEMILYAVEHGAKRIFITLGGSSTNDGGVGMLSALGIRFLDVNHKPIKPCGDALDEIFVIETDSYALKDKDIEIIGACDVTNPLLGKRGATYVFGPQKGVTNLEEMDKKMSYYGRITSAVLGYDYRRFAGTGAAGGLGFAIISYMNGRLAPGLTEIAEMTHLEEAIMSCDLIFTGEGSMDRQTLFGKTPLGVLRLALKHHKPVVGFAGKLEDADELLAAGFYQVRSINKVIKPLPVMLAEGATNLENDVRDFMKDYQQDVSD